MVNEQNLDTLGDLIEKLLLFLGRPVVQLQIVVIVAAIVLSALLARWLWSLTRRRFPAWEEIDSTDQRQVYKWRLLVVVDYLIFPILNIITIAVANTILRATGSFAGLLTTFNFLFWAFLIYRIFLGALYVLFPFEDVRRYHNRLLTPLFSLFIAGRILGEFTDLNTLTRVVITTLFNSPVTLGALFLATIGLYFWIDASLGLQDILHKIITRNDKVDPGAIEATLTLGRYILIAIGLFIVFSSLNFDPTTMAAITGGLSVGVGFALREVLSNFLSGIFLLFEGSLHPGDVIDVEGQISVVKRLSIRSTHVQTRDNVEIVIPNQIFFTSSFTTYTGSDRQVRLMIPIGTSYNNNPEEVIKILEAIGRDNEDVLTTPAPSALLSGFGDSSIDFKLAVWIADPIRTIPIISDLNRSIWEKFAENDIEIPFPQQDIHVRSGIPWEKVENSSP